MPLPVMVVVVVLCVTLVTVLLGYLVHRNADRHDSEGGR
jgi:hypothetical protein